MFKQSYFDLINWKIISVSVKDKKKCNICKIILWRSHYVGTTVSRQLVHIQNLKLLYKQSKFNWSIEKKFLSWWESTKLWVWQWKDKMATTIHASTTVSHLLVLVQWELEKLVQTVETQFDHLSWVSFRALIKIWHWSDNTVSDSFTLVLLCHINYSTPENFPQSVKFESSLKNHQE